VVLILGRFSQERKPVLDALREALRNHPNGYIAVLFDFFELQHDKPVLETVKTLASLARFVIADLTDPHLVRSELTYITANVPIVPCSPSSRVMSTYRRSMGRGPSTRPSCWYIDMPTYRTCSPA
jgi:hypothetical protein